MGLLKSVYARLFGPRRDGTLLAEMKGGGTRYELSVLQDHSGKRWRVGLRYDSTHLPFFLGETVIFWLSPTAQQELLRVLRENVDAN